MSTTRGQGDKASSKLPYKPLFNKRFYLDLKGYRSTANITADIRNLGGIVEEFLSREVNYVISTRGSQGTGGSSSELQPSPSTVHTASPHTPQQPFSSLPSTSHDSPLNIDSPREESGKKRVRTRAEVLLERACVRRQGTCDVLENARLWNVPVWPLAKLLKWIALLKEDGRYRPPQKSSAINHKHSSSSPKVQRLKSPFIKTESFSRQYKPVFKELTVWPELKLSNPPGISPFADPKQSKTPKTLKASSFQKDDFKERQKAKERNAGRNKESGYCELCTTNYPKLKLHLQSDTHLAFVRNDKNYQKLDELIDAYTQGAQMPKTKCTSEAQNTPWAAKKKNSRQPSIPLRRTTNHKLANDKKLPEKDNSYIPMRYSGLMQAERRPSSLSSVTNKRLRKQIVFEIGETIHSGPTHLVQKDIKNEKVGPASNCVLPGDTLESACALPESNCPADIPSTRCSSSRLSSTPVYRKGSVPRKPSSSVGAAALPRLSQSKCKVGDTVEPKAPLLTVQVPEAVVPKAKVFIHDALAVPQASVSEATIPDVTVSEAALPEVTLDEAALPDVPVTKAVSKATFFNVATKVKQEKETPCAFKPFIKQEPPNFVESVIDDYSLDVTLSPVVDPIQVKKENIEMVRLIQEVDSRIDSFCHKRSSRTSKRFGSSEIEEIEIKTEQMSRAKRCTRTRKSSCRSDKSESETSDSRSVLEDPLCLDMVDKTAKRGKPKNGEPILEEAAAHTNKYNGDVSVDLVNGAHKVKGRRVSRANSDESDLSSCSKTNGNVDHNNDKIDFSLLLEISEADREKFETKKAKIRRKTADWLLISETEQYYNEKEEIMRNKNKPDSESDSDESDSDSKSDCSDDNENEDANPPRGRGKGKRKQSGCAGDDDPKVSAKRIKEDLDSSNVRGRPIGSRTRKTRYDLTMLNDDEDDDDENFFGFPVSTTIPPSTESCSLTSSSLCQSRSKGKGTTKGPAESSSSSGKAGKKRLSDAERFLRDNREYYHFQETKERLRRSTSSSSGDKEKVGNGDDTSCHVEKRSEKKEESKVKETSVVSRKRPSLDMARRVTRRTGGSLDLECEGDVKGDKKVVIKEEKDLKMEGRNATRSERRDGYRFERRVEVKAERIDEPRKEGMRSERRCEKIYSCCDKKDATKVEKCDKEKLKDEKEKLKENKKSKEVVIEKGVKEDHKGKVDDKKEKVIDRKEKTDDKKERVEDKKEKIEDKKEKVLDKKEKVVEKTEKVEDKRGKVEDKRDKVEDKRDKVEDKRDKVEDKKDKVEDKKDKVEDKKDKVEDKRDKVEDKRDKVEDKRDKVEDKRDKVEDRKDKVEDRKDKVEDKKDKVEDKKDKVDNKKEKVEDKKEKVEDKKEKVEDKTGKVDGKKENVEDKKEKVGDKKEKVDEKKEKVEGKKDKIDSNKKIEDKIEKVEDKREKLKDKKESEENVIRDERKKEVTEEEKVEDVNKKKELKDENKNGLKDKEIGELLDQKLSVKSDTQILRRGVGVGKCIVKTEKDSIKTSEISDSFESSLNNKVKSDDIESREKLEVREKVTNAGYGNTLDELYFSFEGVPENECWYQTYQRFIDGIAVNEFVYDEDPLKFILPYEMPKEYIRDFISLKKGLFCKKKNDLADLVRKSPRCHASTLALFSDIIPTRRGKGSKGVKSVPVKVEEISSDGTSTPGADSIRMPPHECFESVEELAILALHLDHVIKTELDGEEASLCIPVLKDMKDTDETDLRKTPPKKRGKKRRLLASSKSSKGVENVVKEMKMFESPFAHEVDPAFIAGLSDDVRDLVPENILSRAAVEVIEDSNQCLCNDRPSCEDFSSADENTEASSECVSLCDSETIDSSTASEPKPVRSNKKRRKNLTGWPKAQKKKKAVASHTSDDNDSAFGYDDSEPKRRGCRIKQDFCFLEQTTAQKLAALAANDRRASPRKKASVLYMDTWPVRFRTQK
ncbi:titin homolog isoform X2 [Palaemon carinicauda]|uniref:titin homolog isoform X2 n=1 Tax=Palaemon carinicauda TaxID=392227 RepID=UPI0035B58047